MCLLLKEQPAPEIKIDVFDGKPMEFHYFLTDEKRVNDEWGKITRLIKYANGDAKDMVKNSIQLPPEDGLKAAKHLLNERYGDPHRIIAAYRCEISNGHRSNLAYQRLQNVLIKCENTANLQIWNVFNMPDIICMLRKFKR